MGYILYGAAIHIVKVEDDFHEMQELKVRAEAADVAKSQVVFRHVLKVQFILNFMLQLCDLIRVLLNFLVSVSCYRFA